MVRPIGFMVLWALACAGLGTRPSPPPAPLPVPAPLGEPERVRPVDEPPVPLPPPPVFELSALATPPEGFVDLRVTLQDAQFTIRYATPDNFTGTVLPGYGAPGAWLRAAPAQALAAVQAELAQKGLTLRIYDAYRPLRATRGMVAWAQRADRVDLLDQHYVSRYSGHNRGNTIDLSVAERASGQELDMGTPWDTLNESSHTRNATGPALANRLLLKDMMERHGFKNYWKEWWHYTFLEPGEAELPHRDVPYGCAEPPEGKWSAPAGWTEASWVAVPLPSGPCR